MTFSIPNITKATDLEFKALCKLIDNKKLPMNFETDPSGNDVIYDYEEREIMSLYDGAEFILTEACVEGDFDKLSKEECVALLNLITHI